MNLEDIKVTLPYRYRLLTEIGSGGMGTVYSVFDQLTSQQVALKRVSIAPLNLAFSQRETHDTSDPSLALAREFRMMATLRHPQIIEVWDYGFGRDGVPYYTMTLIERAETILTDGERRDLAGKVQLLLDLLQALRYLHRRDILHRDIKPSNLLVDPQGHLKVMDFGLSVEIAQARGVTGTLTYMAPEIIRDEKARVESDLYSVGVIAYELFAGQHPFETQYASTLIHQILNAMPDVNRLQAPAPLRAVIMQLLAKTPGQRCATASETIAAICAAMGRDIPGESIEVRDSFLRAARFVGRQTEFEQLNAALEAVLRGQGSAWVVAGESGVGKSRLLEELRIRALVEGCLVLRGQAVEGGGLPYEVLRGLLPGLLVTTTLKEHEIGTLRPLLTHIPHLIEAFKEESQDPYQRIDQQQLIASIAALFERQTQPIVILLEDLHWAAEDIPVIRALCRLALQRPLLIVGNYRSDDAPYLYGQLPEMRLLPLRRLERAEINELADSILGEGMYPQDVVDLLANQSEGNIFLMLDILQSLAETTGRLEEVGRQQLPRQIMSKHTMELARRRISHLPLDDLPMLRLSAVIGREIDFKLLRYVDDEMDWGDWLMRLANSAILDVADNKWRFAHNKIREGILLGLETDYIVRLNALAAEAIEAVYPANPAYALRLASHWRMARNVVKTVDYTRIAVESFLLHNDPRQALELLEQCLALVGAPATRDYGALLALLGNTYGAMGLNEKAASAYRDSLTIAEALNDGLGQARVLQGLGAIYLRTGVFDEARQLLQQSAALYHALNVIQGEAAVLALLGYAYYQPSEFEQAQRYYERSLELYQQLNDLLGMADALLGLGRIALYQQAYSGSEQRLEQAMMLYQRAGSQYGQGMTLLAYGLNALHQQQYDAAEKQFTQALKLLEASQRQYDMAVCFEMLGAIAKRRGQYRQAKAQMLRALELYRAVESKLGAASALTHLASIHIANHDPLVSYSLLTEAIKLTQELGFAWLYLKILLVFVDLLLEKDRAADAAVLLAYTAAHPALEPDHQNEIDYIRARQPVAQAWNTASQPTPFVLSPDALPQQVLAQVKALIDFP